MTSYQDEDGSWCCWDGMAGADCGHTAENMPPRAHLGPDTRDRRARRLLAAERLAEAVEKLELYADPLPSETVRRLREEVRSALSAWKEAGK